MLNKRTEVADMRSFSYFDAVGRHFHLQRRMVDNVAAPASTTSRKNVYIMYFDVSEL